MGAQLAFLNPTKTPPKMRKLAGRIAPTNTERTFGFDELIVSKTDLKGRMTYVNDVFLRLAGFTEYEMIGAPHSVIRHPDMPRCVFKLLWDWLSAEKEIFAYVKNMSSNGDYYWVLAHVTPSYNKDGTLCGYHSNRRKPARNVIDQIIAPLYADLLAIEKTHTNKDAGMNAALEKLVEILTLKGTNYDEFILSL